MATRAGVPSWSVSRAILKIVTSWIRRGLLADAPDGDPLIVRDGMSKECRTLCAQVSLGPLSGPKLGSMRHQAVHESDRLRLRVNPTLVGYTLWRPSDRASRRRGLSTLDPVKAVDRLVAFGLASSIGLGAIRFGSNGPGKLLGCRRDSVRACQDYRGSSTVARVALRRSNESPLSSGCVMAVPSKSAAIVAVLLAAVVILSVVLAVEIVTRPNPQRNLDSGAAFPSRNA